jgi:predicted house-cleaning noncanonical NTP pyrophosphatase (MazG superfamily)
MTDGKLVRDLIPDIIRASGRDPEIRYLTGAELLAALGAKLCEEAREAAEAVGSRPQLVEELADVHEALAALMGATGITGEEVIAAAREKLRERGGFDTGVWLVTPTP